MNATAAKVYISYAWGGESERIAGELDADLASRGIQIVRDKRDLGYKGQIRGFMQEIGRGHAVIVIISDKYLKSPNCMFELVEVARASDVYERIFPVVLADAEIYDPVKRVGYIRHWEQQVKALDEAMRSVSAANLQGLREELDSYDAIRDHVSRLTFLLKDMNTLTPDMHENSNFASLIAAVEQRLRASVAAPAVPAAPAPARVPVSAAPAPAPAPAPSRGDFAAYTARVIEALTAQGFQPLQGERFEDLRFRPAFEKYVKGFIADDRHRVLFLDAPGLDAARFAEIEEAARGYTDESRKRAKTTSNMYNLFVVLADTVPRELRKRIAAQPPLSDEQVTEGRMFTIAVYDAAADDLYCANEVPTRLDAMFDDLIKQTLTP